MIEVELAPLLLSYTGGARTVKARGDTLSELMADLDRQYPGLRFRVIDEQDRVRPHMRFFLNGFDVRSLDVKVRPGDQVFLVGALSGG